MSLKALVVDDEPMARDYLALLLTRIGGLEVVGKAETGEEALEMTQEMAPDVVFLDIRMPGMDGLETARYLNEMENPPWIIFCTGYGEYALEAFEACALDYILKPYDEERLRKALSRIRRFEQEGRTQEEIRRAGKAIERMIPQVSKVPIRVHHSIKLLDPAEILYVQAKGKKVYMKTLKGEFPIPYTVTQMERKLAPFNFIRANEGCIVNLNRVKEVVHLGERSYELLLNDKEGTTVELSRTRARALREFLRELL